MDPNAQPGFSTYRLEISAKPPTSWGVIVGDITQNLRAALDYVAWELSQVSGKSIKKERDISFPLMNKLDERGFQRATTFMCTEAADMIRKFQPYNVDNWSELSLLWILNELSRIDKHRLLIRPSPGAVFRFSPRSEWHEIGLKSDLELIVPRATIEAVGDDFEPQFAPNVSFNITDSNSMLDDMTVFVLDDIHKFIRDELIPCFTRFFK